MAAKKTYKVVFYNQDEVFEIYAAHVFPSEMYGFIELEEILFGERSQLLVDPSEEKLKSEFAGVTRTYVPMNAIVRIDEVEQCGVPKVKPSQVAQFPGGNNSKK
ncbi:hypothetical protein A3715_09440 [Oleiphilus sp. HI0009]|nr:MULTISPECIES: DUF1820 family protein [unclassified Oleiphilus]KZX79031.1 hypothetical protein A3715_09440 [Oleiphilus sp. HI0009]KZY66252.1 hypothetical protein A3738_06920 [Oleiphilus sp. HI0066]KZY71987.1 hypothetical protein A3739_03715 [Oleiphilus sp. HI0067]KZZ59209.1 hypothetical protein A3762_05650 [Oleiphilus sp. HI0125]